MTVDNLVSAEVVLADGRTVRASAGEHPDLHWALRGGGGNFGVVTSFEFRVHELGPEVYGLHTAYALEDAERVLAGWRDAVADAPDALSTAGLIWTLPDVDVLPEPLRGRPYVGIAGMWAGDPDEGERATRALRELAAPLIDTRAFWRAALPFSDGKTYFNFPGLLEEGDDAVRASYGANHSRLARIKAAYDPENRFRLDQNIKPA